VRKWLRGDSEPNVSDVRAICAVSGATLDWLINGVGDSGLIPLAVRETPATYGAPPAPMDHSLLEKIMTAVEEAAVEVGGEIAINRKSSLVTALYGLCRASGAVDRSAILRLMKLAV
jgi:hypothetical protein